MVKLPIGIKPRVFWLRQRMDECNRTIQNCEHYIKETSINPTDACGDFNVKETLDEVYKEWNYACQLYREDKPKSWDYQGNELICFAIFIVLIILLMVVFHYTII